MKFDTAVFDFDYTLADGTDAIAECYNYALAIHGKPAAEREAVRKTVGMTVRDSFRVLSDERDPEKIEAMRLLFRKRADEILAAGTRLYPDCIPLLTYLKIHGIKTAIVSSKERFRIDEILSRDGAEELMDLVIGVSDAPVPKPSPSGLLKAAEQLGAADVLYVGDTLIDAETAWAASLAASADLTVSFAAVTTGTTQEHEFRDFFSKSGQSVYGVFADLTELLSSLGKEEKK